MRKILWAGVLVALFGGLAAGQTRPAAVAPSPAAGVMPKPDTMTAPFAEKAVRDSQQRWGDYLGTRSELTNAIGMKFSLIPPGTFNMGNHKVTLTRPFYMGEHHVTVGQFRQFVQACDYKTEAEKGGGAFVWEAAGFKTVASANWKSVGFPQGDDHPVVCVDWNDAVAFCKWLSTKENKNYRLPSEAEWEYSAKAGTTSAYPWGESPDDGKGWANCADLTLRDKYPTFPTFNWRDGFVNTSPVGSFKANAFGLYDMIGNANQWCQDWYSDKLPTTEQMDPTGPANGTARVFRGGTWNYGQALCRTDTRITPKPDVRSNDLGFRVVLDLPAPDAPPTIAELNAIIEYQKKQITDLTIEVEGLKRQSNATKPKPYP